MAPRASWLGVAGGESEAEDESDPGSEDDPLEMAAEESAMKIRKRAGVPELVLDQLPSSIAGKMLTLNSIKSSFFSVGLLPEVLSHQLLTAHGPNA